MRKLILFSIVFIPMFITGSYMANAQGVGINSSGNAANPSSMLDVSGVSKGVLINRMTTTERDAITNPAQSLLIYNTTVKCFQTWENGLWQDVWCAACPAPAQPSAISGNASPCQGTSQNYSVTNENGITYTWTFPTGWTQTAGGTTNSVTATVGSGSGDIEVVPSNVCGDGPASTLFVMPADPGAPTAGSSTPFSTEIIWQWNTVSGATGYKYSTTNNYSGAIDNLTSTSYSQTGLTCNTAYTLYVWAYNSCGNSSSAALNVTTASCCTIGGDLITSFGTGGVITSNPSTSTDVIYAMAKDGTGLYAAGIDRGPGNNQWRIEKRNLGTGALITTFGSSGVITSNPTSSNDFCYAIAVDGTGLYVAGSDYVGNFEWRIEKRNLTTGGLITTFGTSGRIQSNPSNDNQIYAIAVDGTGLYVAGYDNFPGNAEWRIEKRNLSTGALITTFGTSGVIQINHSSGEDVIRAIAVDGTGLYVAGKDRVPGNDEWRIEKRDLSTGALITTFGTGGVINSNPTVNDDDLFAIAIDGTALYAAGHDKAPGSTQLRIEKRDLGTGALSWSQASHISTDDDQFSAIAVDGTGVYAAGQDRSAGGNNEWRIESRSISTGALIWGQSINPSSGNDICYAILVDGTGLYAGGNAVLTNGEWRIEKRCK